MKVQGEAAVSIVEAAASYPEELAEITDEGGYTTADFHCRWNDLLLEEDASRTFIIREKSLVGFRASKDWPTLLRVTLSWISAHLQFWKS